ncbi:CPBP family glutamic-type intramembrane protease [Aquimarina algiphila]|nr:CPBP family glutamic-type intramembrane protease [Aquimarina algiphila]
MLNSHYVSLIIAYALAALLWLLTNFFIKSIWNIEKKELNFSKPYLEFIYALIAMIPILGIGQLYINHLLIPNPNNASVIIDTINQFLIFSPTLILIFIRKQSFDTIWLPKSKILLRITIGLCIAICSLFAYWITRKDIGSFGEMLFRIYHSKNLAFLMQVFMEDITIALLFVRLSAWINRKWTIILVAILFACGHIPSFVAGGATLIELSSLLIDTCIGILILTVISKSKDVWWFFMVHYALDMSQFVGST